MQKVLITTSSFGEYSNLPLEKLKENGYESVLNPYKRKVSEKELQLLLNEHSPVALIAGTEEIGSKIISSSKKHLKCISRVGAGWDNVDHQSCKLNGVSVFRTVDAVTPAVAELTIGLILDLLRNVTIQNNQLKSGVWKKQMGSLLSSKTVGVWGAGRIGKRVSELLKGFGTNVLCHDICKDEIWASRNEVSYIDNFEKFITQIDLLTIHCSYNKKMEGVLNKDTFNKVKMGFALVNLSRGELIVEEDLIEAIENEKIAGAALDVFREEPYKGRLTSLENTILTPHIGSYAKETRIQMEIEAVDNFLKTF